MLRFRLVHVSGHGEHQCVCVHLHIHYIYFTFFFLLATFTKAIGLEGFQRPDALVVNFLADNQMSPF